MFDPKKAYNDLPFLPPPKEKTETIEDSPEKSLMVNSKKPGKIGRGIQPHRGR
ncbi:hypothetical protein [Salinispira pacifica]|uniref:hypothetical protein n=1 Tax=Salinispira pacifica TaxID=1307761 RepID=UPI00146FC439|nr:hypothetical protein [Salinispira pacifica]